jgi:phosphatidylserine decarboxylase
MNSSISAINNYIAHAPEAVILPLVLFSIAVVFKKKYIAIGILIIFMCLLFFYRGAPRAELEVASKYSDNIVIAPCNGRIMKIIERGDKLQLSVFLNVHNIHVQYVPIGGRVRSIMHKDGEFHPAYFFEKSQFNERVETIIETFVGDVHIVQIAGQVARRIVSFLEVGEKVERSDPLGLIKFGSRVDIWLPKTHVKSIHVKEDEVVNIGQPIITLH